MFEYFIYALLLLVVVIALTAAGIVVAGGLIIVCLSWIVSELVLGITNVFIWIYNKLSKDGKAEYLSMCRFLS